MKYIENKQIKRVIKPMFVCMRLDNNKVRRQCTKKLGKKRIQRLFAEQGKYDSHFKSIGGYIIADC